MKTFVLLFAASVALLASVFQSQAVSGPDPAPVPVLAVTASNATTSEGSGEPGRFTIQRTGDTTEPLVVFYRIAGTAANAA